MAEILELDNLVNKHTCAHMFSRPGGITSFGSKTRHNGQKKKKHPSEFLFDRSLVRGSDGPWANNPKPPPLFRGPTDESFFGDGRQTQYLGLNEDSMQKVDNDTPRPYIKLSQLKI